MLKKGSENWWGLPYYGPCGPSSEIFYLLDKNEVDGVVDRVNNEMKNEEAYDFTENQIIEIWNHVFMEYEGERGEDDEPTNYKPLAKKNIDTGMGFERLLAVINGLDTVYKTDVIAPIVDVANKWAAKENN